MSMVADSDGNGQQWLCRGWEKKEENWGGCLKFSKKKKKKNHGKTLNLTATSFIFIFLMKSIDNHTFRSQGT